MAKHKFENSMMESGLLAGVVCTRCGQVVPFENGRIPGDIAAQECPVGREDVNQAAARVVREATERF
jgi:hypothetical protein